jgi:hypothetical protein
MSHCEEVQQTCMDLRMGINSKTKWNFIIRLGTDQLISEKEHCHERFDIELNNEVISYKMHFIREKNMDIFGNATAQEDYIKSQINNYCEGRKIKNGERGRRGALANIALDEIIKLVQYGQIKQNNTKNMFTTPFQNRAVRQFTFFANQEQEYKLRVMFSTSQVQCIRVCYKLTDFQTVNETARKKPFLSDTKETTIDFEPPDKSIPYHELECNVLTHSAVICLNEILLLSSKTEVPFLQDCFVTPIDDLLSVTNYNNGVRLVKYRGFIHIPECNPPRPPNLHPLVTRVAEKIEIKTIYSFTISAWIVCHGLGLRV